ncbi:MAG TPA: PKD domain-containing protein [Nitrososphaeraceae archaeon]|nr:PKD domain-containing protein [Nitrososphaeraceae archaeon]
MLSPAFAITLIATTIIVILFTTTTNLPTVANAQQTSPNSDQAVTQKTTSEFQNTQDGFRVRVPEGWVVRDLHNTGFRLLSEVLQGYGVLAQLCPEGQQQQALNNVGDSSSNSSSSCQASPGEDIIHIIRYPNLGARLGFAPEDIFTIINRDTIPNTILAYHMQKLQEVGYRDIRILNSIDTTINVISTGLNNNRIATSTVPAKLVEMTYSTNSAPNETRTGYFMLTATAATPRNLGDITGYSIFYEGETDTTPSGSLPLTLSPASISQVLDSFELIAAATQPLAVEISSDDSEGVAPATFDFEADVTGGMEPFTISWGFDEDSDEEDEEDDDTVDHTFDEPGNYTVSATVRDSTGQTVSDSILITVEPPPPLTRVNIISNDTEGVAPATFDFEANATGGAEPLTYSWDFDDGSIEEDDDATFDHTFDEAGTYNVDLTVTDSTGQTVSDSILITVEPPPLPSPPPSPSQQPSPPPPQSPLTTEEPE